MAAKGSVASIRKKLMSRLSAGDDRRNSPVKILTPAVTDAAGLAGDSTTKRKKDHPSHLQTKNMDGRQQSSVGGRRSSTPTTSSPHHQNDITAVDCLDEVPPHSPTTDITDSLCMQHTSAPVDLVASCSARPHNRPTTSGTAVIGDDVITSLPQQHNDGSCVYSCSQIIAVSLSPAAVLLLWFLHVCCSVYLRFRLYTLIVKCCTSSRTMLTIILF